MFAVYLPGVSNSVPVRQCPLVCLAQLQHELLLLLLHMLFGIDGAPAKVCPCSGVCKVLKGNPDSGIKAITRCKSHLRTVFS